MKPSCPVARRADYQVAEIAFELAREFIAHHHYARGAGKLAVYSFGLFRAHRLVGAATWLPPTKPCAMTIDKARWREVLSLSRLAILNGEPQNAASLFIARMIWKIRADNRWKALVTFADTWREHTGTIYRAANWIEKGLTAATPVWTDECGRLVSIKSGPETRSDSEMFARGYKYIGHFSKIKFAYYL